MDRRRLRNTRRRLPPSRPTLGCPPWSPLRPQCSPHTVRLQCSLYPTTVPSTTAGWSQYHPRQPEHPVSSHCRTPAQPWAQLQPSYKTLHQFMLPDYSHRSPSPPKTFTLFLVPFITPQSSRVPLQPRSVPTPPNQPEEPEDFLHDRWKLDDLSSSSPMGEGDLICYPM